MKNLVWQDPATLREHTLTALTKNIAEVTFTKANGTQRVLRGTLNPAFAPSITVEQVEAAKNTTRDQQSVYDVEANAWRSFNWGTVSAVRSDAI